MDADVFVACLLTLAILGLIGTIGMTRVEFWRPAWILCLLTSIDLLVLPFVLMHFSRPIVSDLAQIFAPHSQRAIVWLWLGTLLIIGIFGIGICVKTGMQSYRAWLRSTGASA